MTIEEYRSNSTEERQLYTEGYVAGYVTGKTEACEEIDAKTFDELVNFLSWYEEGKRNLATCKYIVKDYLKSKEEA